MSDPLIALLNDSMANKRGVTVALNSGECEWLSMAPAQTVQSEKVMLSGVAVVSTRL